eukprot:scaffold57769_cov32-Tisochrysis_lutea.AAC.2
MLHPPRLAPGVDSRDHTCRLKGEVLDAGAHGNIHVDACRKATHPPSSYAHRPDCPIGASLPDCFLGDHPPPRLVAK